MISFGDICCLYKLRVFMADALFTNIVPLRNGIRHAFNVKVFHWGFWYETKKKILCIREKKLKIMLK